MGAAASLMQRAGERDRALLARFSLTEGSSPLALRFWRTVTRAGGAGATISVAAAPLIWNGPVRAAASRSLTLLVVSHLLVQLVKRSVGRPRPATPAGRIPVASIPDRFSFPSGHAAAAMSIALGYSSLHPTLLVPLTAVAMLVGSSRVVLGVHYPGDVAAGQLIALLTASLLPGIV